MADIFHSNRKNIYFFSVLFIVWVFLFEFILTPNQVLPRPTIVIISIISLFKDYQFLINLISSISAIYFSFLIAGFFLFIFRRLLINNKNLFGFLSSSLERISGIIPGILMGMFLIFWFPGSEIIKYIFIFFTTFTFLINKLENELINVKGEFIDAVRSLGCGKNFISEKVIWKIVEPTVVESLKELHLYLWSMLIVFELIQGGSGLGTVLKRAIMYKDLAGLFSSIIIICLIIFVGANVIKYFKNKFFFWSLD